MRHTVAAAAIGTMFLVAACSPDEGEEEEFSSDLQQDEQSGQNPIPEPEYDSDDTVRLPIGLVSPPGHNEIAPIGEDGRIQKSRPQGPDGQPTGPSPHQTEIARTESFGCSDTISVVQTVPVVTDDPAHTALDYLFTLEGTTHGSPEFGNPMARSEGVTVDSVQHDDGEVTVSLEDEPVVTDSCDMWRVAMQIETTARIATGADQAVIQYGDTTLAEHWGLSEEGPLQITEIERD